MPELIIISLILALILFILGVILFVKYFPWKIQKPIYMAIVIDTTDYKTYDAVIQILSTYNLMDARYSENEDVIRMDIGVSKEDYQPILKSVSTLQNLEVI